MTHQMIKQDCRKLPGIVMSTDTKLVAITSFQLSCIICLLAILPPCPWAYVAMFRPSRPCSRSVRCTSTAPVPPCKKLKHLSAPPCFRGRLKEASQPLTERSRMRVARSLWQRTWRSSFRNYLVCLLDEGVNGKEDVRLQESFDGLF